MARRDRRNELLAGGFILLSIALVVVVLLLLANWRGLVESHQDVTVIFKDQSVKGLAEGATVEFNGVPVGKVQRLKLDYGRPNEIHAVLRVPRDLRLYTNAALYVGTAALGGTSWIAIDNVGGEQEPPGQGAPIVRADTDHAIFAQSRPNTLIGDVADTAGLGPPQRTQIQETIAFVHATSRVLSETMTQIRDELLPAARGSLSNIHRMTDDGVAVTASVRQKLPATLDRMDAAVANVQTLIAEQTPVLASAVAHLESLTRTLDTQSAAQLESIAKAVVVLQEALGKASESMGDIRQVTGTLRQVVVANRDTLDDTLANFREGSEHFSAALSEIRREPWRLLSKPKPAEEQSANVMAAARAFAEGADRVHNTATRLAAMKASAPATAPDNGLVDKTLADLKESMQRFHKAEQALYQALSVP